LVGGGDINPITRNGRIITAILMIVGITFVGFLIASLASWAVKNPAEEKKQPERLETMEKSLKKLENNMEELKELIEKKI
jgi:voltage-gated potassium channel